MIERLPLDERGSFAWLAGPADPLDRASCAIAVEGGCVVADPVDVAGLDDALAEVGPVLGVATLLDRHRRDAARVAERLGVPRLLPRALGGTGIALPGVEERTVVDRPGWHEALLWLPERGLLVCAEAVGTGRFYVARPGDSLGVHPLLRLFPPRRAFAGLEPRTIACGHGAPLSRDAAAELRRALASARRDLPRALASAAREYRRARPR